MQKVEMRAHLAKVTKNLRKDTKQRNFSFGRVLRMCSVTKIQCLRVNVDKNARYDSKINT